MSYHTPACCMLSKPFYLQVFWVLTYLPKQLFRLDPILLNQGPNVRLHFQRQAGNWKHNKVSLLCRSLGIWMAFCKFRHDFNPVTSPYTSWDVGQAPRTIWFAAVVLNLKSLCCSCWQDVPAHPKKEASWICKWSGFSVNVHQSAGNWNGVLIDCWAHWEHTAAVKSLKK